MGTAANQSNPEVTTASGGGPVTGQQRLRELTIIYISLKGKVLVQQKGSTTPLSTPRHVLANTSFSEAKRHGKQPIPFPSMDWLIGCFLPVQLHTFPTVHTSMSVFDRECAAEWSRLPRMYLTARAPALREPTATSTIRMIFCILRLDSTRVPTTRLPLFSHHSNFLARLLWGVGRA